MRTFCTVVVAALIAAVSADTSQGPPMATYWDFVGANTPSNILAVNGVVVWTDYYDRFRAIDQVNRSTRFSVNITGTSSSTVLVNDSVGNVYWKVDGSFGSWSNIYQLNTTTFTLAFWNYSWGSQSSCTLSTPTFANGWMFTGMYCSGGTTWYYGTNKQAGGTDSWNVNVTGTYAVNYAVSATTFFTYNSSLVLGYGLTTGMLTWNDTFYSNLGSYITTLYTWKTYLFVFGSNYNFLSYDTSSPTANATVYQSQYSSLTPQWGYTNSTGDYIFVTYSYHLFVYKIGTAATGPGTTWNEPNMNSITLSGYQNGNLWMTSYYNLYVVNPDTFALSFTQTYSSYVAVRLTWNNVAFVSTPSSSYGSIWTYNTVTFRPLAYQFVYDSIRSVAFASPSWWNLTAFVVDSGSHFYAFGLSSAAPGWTWNTTVGSFGSCSSYGASATLGDASWSFVGGMLSGTYRNGSVIFAAVSTGNCLSSSQAVTAWNGMLVAAVSGGGVVVYNAATGAQLKLYSTVNTVQSFFTDATSNSVYFVDTYNDKVAKISLASITTLPTTLVTSAAITGTLNPSLDVSTTSNVYAVSGSTLYCYTKTDLSACAIFGASGKSVGYGSASPPVVIGGRVYIVAPTYTTSTGYTLKLMAYGTDTSLELQSTVVNTGVSYYTPPLSPFVFAGQLYMFDNNNNFVGYNSAMTKLFSTPTALTYNAQMVSTAYGGVFVFAQSYTLYALNSTGGSIWNWTTPSISTVTLGSIYNGVLYINAGYYLYAIDVYKGKVLYEIYDYGSTFYGVTSINETVIFSQTQSGSSYATGPHSYGFTYFMNFYNASTLPPLISGSAGDETLLEKLEKNKLWIIGIVAAIVVLAVIVVIANKNRGGTGAKDQDYVSMNNQGGRV